MMKRLVTWLFYVGTSLLLACLIAPSFIDWNQHKADVLAQISPYFQRKVDVAGNISFRILPQPEMTMESVTVANAAGSKAGSLITLKSLNARIKLEPLLEGRIEVENISLTDPVLNLEISAEGKANWSGVLADGTGLGVTAAAIRLNQVMITNGTLNYINQQTGSQRSIENMNLAVTADTLLGPYRISGDMQYQKAQVKLDMDTGVYDKTMSAPVHIAFKPVEGLPQVDINGVMDLQSGLDIQGEASVTGNNPGGLLNIKALNALGFMHDSVDMTGTFEFKGDQFVLNDIKAKFGQSGDLRGKLSVQFSRNGKPSVIVDLEGNNLTATEKPADTYMAAPEDFEGKLHFKGKNIVWDGWRLGSVDISTAFNQKEWAIKSAQVSLPGNSQIKLSGTVTPKTDSGAYTALQVTTDDLGKLVDAFAPADSSIFKSLGGSGPVKKFALAGSLQVSPASISFFNMDATVGDRTKITGVLNIDRSLPKPNFTAKLNFSDWDDAAFPADAYDGFLHALMKSSADMEFTAKNYTKGGLRIAGMTFKGKTGEQGLDIVELDGALSDKENFTLKGHVASLAPLSGMDITYTVQAARVADVAKALNIDLPPLGMSWENFALKGGIKGDSLKYTFTAQGGGDDLVWQGLHIFRSAMTVEADPSSVKISGLEGTVWSGQLNAALTFIRQEQAAVWSSGFKGNLKQADLRLLGSQMGFKVFPAGTGDIDFDLTSLDNAPGSLSGAGGIQNGNVTVEKFNFDKLGDAVHQMKEVPADLQLQIDNLLRDNGSTTFKDVQGRLKVDHGKLSIEKMSLSNASGEMAVTGAADVPAGSFDLSGELQLGKPEGFPALKVLRTAEMPDYTVDSHPIGKFIIKNNPAPVPVPPVASPAPPVDKGPIKDILKRLDESEQPHQQPTPPAQPPSPPQPDVINKKLLQMEMQELMPKDTGAPTPLTP